MGAASGKPVADEDDGRPAFDVRVSSHAACAVARLVRASNACSSNASLPTDKPALSGRPAWESATTARRGSSCTDVRGLGVSAAFSLLSMPTGYTQQKADKRQRR
jgi:hypothetical protein